MTRNVIWQHPSRPCRRSTSRLTTSAARPRGADPRVRRLRVPYSRQAFRAIERVEQELGGGVRFCFRHFPLTGIHPHALAAAAAAEAAARQGRFWDMHALLFHRQRALEDDDLRRYATGLGLDVALSDHDRASDLVLERVRRDVDSGIASGEVRGTPTLFIDGVVHRGSYDPATLLRTLAR